MKKKGAWEEFESDCSHDRYLASDMLQTGDILLYHPKCEFNKWSDLPFWCFDKAIMAITKSEYSHASLVIRDPQFTTPPMKGLFVLESNRESFPDVEDNEIKTGVELVHLEDVLKIVNLFKPKKTILTNLHSDLDYNQLLKILPNDILPGYDGLSVNI